MGLMTSALFAAALATSVADMPRHEGDFVIHDFRFHTGERLPELRQHYVTLGDPKNPAVLVLHGTSGNGAGLLNAGFGGELFGPGQPLDAVPPFHHPARLHRRGKILQALGRLAHEISPLHL